MIAGGGAPEIEASLQLSRWAKTLQGVKSYCVNAYAEALEVIPYTLAENAGLNPIAIVTELRNRHASGEKTTGINVRKVIIPNLSIFCSPLFFLSLSRHRNLQFDRESSCQFC
jgi:T-complex protein 1 subunit delta